MTSWEVNFRKSGAQRKGILTRQVEFVLFFSRAQLILLGHGVPPGIEHTCGHTVELVRYTKNASLRLPNCSAANSKACFGENKGSVLTRALILLRSQMPEIRGILYHSPVSNSCPACADARKQNVYNGHEPRRSNAEPARRPERLVSKRLSPTEIRSLT